MDDKSIIQNLLGRYESGYLYVNFELKGNLVIYNWGSIGFLNSTERLMTISDMETHVQELLNDGWEKVLEAPVSEGVNPEAGILVDWMSGVTR